MSFDIKQMPASSEKKINEAERVSASLNRFKIWFAGIVLVCASVIIGAAIFYYQLNN
ncbi:MAG: hypothetical protein OQK46_00935 [Gammaproteobacteria bacterium]|nr:hypothetical protein [Gammaproteobacteria bacterium]